MFQATAKIGLLISYQPVSVYHLFVYFYSSDLINAHLLMLFVLFLCVIDFFNPHQCDRCTQTLLVLRSNTITSSFKY